MNDHCLKEESWYWDINFGKRPQAELYKISTNPQCVYNFAEKQDLSELEDKPDHEMTDELIKERDPHILRNGDIFDQYPYASDAIGNFYNRVRL